MSEFLQGAPLAGLLLPVDEQIVEEDAEISGGYLPGVEKPDGAGRGVAGIGEEGFSGFLALSVDLAEGGEREVDQGSEKN